MLTQNTSASAANNNLSHNGTDRCCCCPLPQPLLPPPHPPLCCAAHINAPRFDTFFLKRSVPLKLTKGSANRHCVQDRHQGSSGREVWLCTGRVPGWLP